METIMNQLNPASSLQNLQSTCTNAPAPETMNENSDFGAFRNLLSNFLAMDPSAKLRSARILESYVQNHINMAEIQEILTSSQKPEMLVLFLELMNKLIKNSVNLDKRSTARDEPSASPHWDSSAPQTPNRGIGLRLLEMFMSHLHATCLRIQNGQMPRPAFFLINCLSQTLGLLLGRTFFHEKFERVYFRRFLNRFFLDGQIENWYLIQVGLRVLAFFIQCLLGNENHFKFSRFKSILKRFKKKCLFEIISICKGIFKFLLARTIDLHSLLWVTSPDDLGQAPRRDSSSPERPKYSKKNTSKGTSMLYGTLSAQRSGEKGLKLVPGSLAEYLVLASELSPGQMHIWDYFKLFPSFDSIFGEKQEFISRREKKTFSSCSPEEKRILESYQRQLGQSGPVIIPEVIRETIELALENLRLCVTFPFGLRSSDFRRGLTADDFASRKSCRELRTVVLDFEFFGLAHQYLLGGDRPKQSPAQTGPVAASTPASAHSQFQLTQIFEIVFSSDSSSLSDVKQVSIFERIKCLSIPILTEVADLSSVAVQLSLLEILRKGVFGSQDSSPGSSSISNDNLFFSRIEDPIFRNTLKKIMFCSIAGDGSVLDGQVARKVWGLVKTMWRHSDFYQRSEHSKRTSQNNSIDHEAQVSMGSLGVYVQNVTLRCLERGAELRRAGDMGLNTQREQFAEGNALWTGRSGSFWGSRRNSRDFVFDFVRFYFFVNFFDLQTKSLQNNKNEIDTLKYTMEKLQIKESKNEQALDSANMADLVDLMNVDQSESMFNFANLQQVLNSKFRHGTSIVQKRPDNSFPGNQLSHLNPKSQPFSKSQPRPDFSKRT